MERCSSFNDCPSAQLRLHDTHYLAALQSVTGEGMAVDIHQEKSSIFDLISTDQLEFVVIHLQSSMTLPIRHRLCTHSTTLQQLTATVSWDSFLSSFTQPWDTKNQADFLKCIYALPPCATCKHKPYLDTQIGIFFGEMKTLSWILHSRHPCHTMDHYGPPNLGRE